jgi:hypothetical protein
VCSGYVFLRITETAALQFINTRANLLSSMSTLFSDTGTALRYQV